MSVNKLFSTWDGNLYSCPQLPRIRNSEEKLRKRMGYNIIQILGKQRLLTSLLQGIGSYIELSSIMAENPGRTGWKGGCQRASDVTYDVLLQIRNYCILCFFEKLSKIINLLSQCLEQIKKKTDKSFKKTYVRFHHYEWLLTHFSNR